MLAYDDQLIGIVYSINDSVKLVPTSNRIAFSGELESNSTESYAALLKVVQHFLTNQISQVQVLAGANATSYPLLATSMNGLTLNVEMPPFNQPVIRSLTFQSISLVPSTDSRSVLLSASIIIEINSPLGDRSPLTIQTMDMDAFLIYKNSCVGALNVYGAAVQQIDVTTYRTEFSQCVLVLSEAGISYEKFSKDFINANAIDPILFQISGKASIIGAFALGPLNIDGIPVWNTVRLAGLNGLSEVVVQGISIEGEEQRGLRLSIDATIVNPGIATVELQKFIFQLLDAETHVTLGEIPIDSLAVSPGINQVKLHGFVIFSF